MSPGFTGKQKSNRLWPPQSVMSQRDHTAKKRFTTLKKRSDFLRLRHGHKQVLRTMIVMSAPQPQIRNNPQAHPPRKNSPLKKRTVPTDDVLPRFGFTVTKRMGSAVQRNRIKRRFREAVRQVAPAHAKAGFDYVLIARHSTAEAAFANLLADLKVALKAAHRSKQGGSKQGGKQTGDSKTQGKRKKWPGGKAVGPK